jgi:hypothetical protein
LCQPRVIVKMIVEKQMECRLAGETEGLGENLPQRHFCPLQNPTWPDPVLNPGRRGGKPATNHLSHGAASVNALDRAATVIGLPQNTTDQMKGQNLHRAWITCRREKSCIRDLSLESWRKFLVIRLERNFDFIGQGKIYVERSFPSQIQ